MSYQNWAPNPPSASTTPLCPIHFKKDFEKERVAIQKAYAARNVRRPQREDEQGALWVVELMIDGRYLLFPHDSDNYRVQRAE